MPRRLPIVHLFPAVVFALTLLAGAAASAQTKAFARVPFAFTANHQQFPAGYYKLQLLSDRYLSFSDSKTGKHRGVIMVQPEPVPYLETRGVIRFLMSPAEDKNPDHDRYYLTEIWFAGTSMHSATLLQRSLSRELAELQKTGTPLEIAMNTK